MKESLTACTSREMFLISAMEVKREMSMSQLELDNMMFMSEMDSGNKDRCLNALARLAGQHSMALFHLIDHET
jgi:hypothetical protein